MRAAHRWSRMTATLFDQISRIQAGETLGPVILSYVDFPRSAGWTLKCIIFGDVGMNSDVAATDGTDADSFSLTIPASTTANWNGGRKSFVIEAKDNSGNVYIAERGALTVLWNPRVTTPEMTMLANIRAVKAGFATDGQRTTLIDGVQLQYMSRADLDVWESRLLQIVNTQIGKAGGNGGVYAIKMRTPQDNRYAAPWYGPYPPPGSGGLTQ